MDSKCSLAKSLCIAAMTVAMTATAHAAALRTFVSGFGNDSNTATNCSHAQPCRTFAMAVTVTSSGGEIEALDPAGYGPITISGPLTLVGLPGAAVNAPAGGTGITINAGPNDAVHLQGLLIDGSGLGATGISFTAGKFLTIQDCLIRNLTSHGIAFTPVVASPLVSLHVSSTTVANNGGHGILVFPSGTGGVTATFDRIQVIGNGTPGSGSDGLVAISTNLTTGQLSAVVTESVASRNSNVGFGVVGSTVLATLSVFRSTASLNLTGLESDGNADLTFARTAVTGNSTGILMQQSGQMHSFRDNYLFGNPMSDITGGSINLHFIDTD